MLRFSNSKTAMIADYACLLISLPSCNQQLPVNANFDDYRCQFAQMIGKAIWQQVLPTEINSADNDNSGESLKFVPIAHQTRGRAALTNLLVSRACVSKSLKHLWTGPLISALVHLAASDLSFSMMPSAFSSYEIQKCSLSSNYISPPYRGRFLAIVTAQTWRHNSATIRGHSPD